jgi:hypothetical protein
MTKTIESLSLTTGLCGRRGQRVMSPDIVLAGAVQPDRYVVRG